MEKRYIPRFYYSMSEKLSPHTIGGMIELSKAREVLGGYRFPKEYSKLIIEDMIAFGLLERGQGRQNHLLRVNKIRIPKPGLWFT